MPGFLGFEGANRRTNEFLMEQHTPLFPSPFCAPGSANSCSPLLELRQELTAKAHCHQLYGQTSVKAAERKAMPAGFINIPPALWCRLQTQTLTFS